MKTMANKVKPAVVRPLSETRRRQIAVDAIIQTVHGYGYHQRNQTLRWLRLVRKAHFGLTLEQIIDLGVFPKWAPAAVAHELRQKFTEQDAHPGLREQLESLSLEALTTLNRWLADYRLQERYGTRISEKLLPPAALDGERRIRLSRQDTHNWLRRQNAKTRAARPAPMALPPKKKAVRKHVVTAAEYARNLKRQLAALGNRDFSTQY